MCFIRSRSDYDDDDVVISSRHVRRAPREVAPGRTRDPSPPRAQYLPGPARESRPTTVVQHSPPPVRPRSRTRSPPRRSRVEVVSVQQDARASRGSVARTGGRHGQETVIEHEGERMVDCPRPNLAPGWDTYRYAEPPARRSHSIIETQPRVSLGRVVERERVLVEDGGRRREYYRGG